MTPVVQTAMAAPARPSIQHRGCQQSFSGSPSFVLCGDDWTDGAASGVGPGDVAGEVLRLAASPAYGDAHGAECASVCRTCPDTPKLPVVVQSHRYTNGLHLSMQARRPEEGAVSLEQDFARPLSLSLVGPAERASFFRVEAAARNVRVAGASPRVQTPQCRRSNRPPKAFRGRRPPSVIWEGVDGGWRAMARLIAARLMPSRAP